MSEPATNRNGWQPQPGLQEINDLLANLYVPIAETERDIPWPGDDIRQENVAEHSFSLGLIGAAIGERYGLDPAKIALYAQVHDLTEYLDGDVSLFDGEGRKAKAAKETAALEQIGISFQQTPIIFSTIKAYEGRVDEESQFVYALDKLLPSLMIVRDGGRNWKNHGLTFEEYSHIAGERLWPKVGEHPLVLGWFTELWAEIVERKDELFVSSERVNA